MRELNKDGRLLCELQGNIFEKSAELYPTSSAVFIRRYMNSRYASRMDQDGFMERPADEEEAFDDLNEQYGISNYGHDRLSHDELYWTGYIYRYWAYTYELPSKAVYKICNAKKMHSFYYPYHTLDPMNAIERIMESEKRDMLREDSIEYGVQILRRIRNSK